MNEWNGFAVLKNYEKWKSNVNDEIDLNTTINSGIERVEGRGGGIMRCGIRKQLNTNIVVSQKESYTRTK